jgi:hypothetical protein
MAGGAEAFFAGVAPISSLLREPVDVLPLQRGLFGARGGKREQSRLSAPRREFVSCGVSLEWPFVLFSIPRCVSVTAEVRLVPRPRLDGHRKAASPPGRLATMLRLAGGPEPPAFFSPAYERTGSAREQRSIQPQVP